MSAPQPDRASSRREFLHQAAACATAMSAVAPLCAYFFPWPGVRASTDSDSDWNAVDSVLPALCPQSFSFSFSPTPEVAPYLAPHPVSADATDASCRRSRAR